MAKQGVRFYRKDSLDDHIKEPCPEKLWQRVRRIRNVLWIKAVTITNLGLLTKEVET